jgi:hypothetical protein
MPHTRIPAAALEFPQVHIVSAATAAALAGGDTRRSGNDASSLTLLQISEMIFDPDLAVYRRDWAATEHG